MEPVEINAGGCYLRQLRADTHLDDRPALVAAFAEAGLRRWAPQIQVPTLADAANYIGNRADQWQADVRYTWAVAEPTTGALLGEVCLKDPDTRQGTAEIGCWTHPEHRGRGIVTEAVSTIVRFAFGGLGLHHVSYRHSADNAASQRVAEKCGFHLDGRLRDAVRIDDTRYDLLIWTKLATDAGA